MSHKGHHCGDRSWPRIAGAAAMLMAVGALAASAGAAPASAAARLAAHSPADARDAAGVETRRYTADPSDFPNPERGFSQQGGSPEAARKAGLSLVHIYFRLDPYRNAPLPDAYLAMVERSFAQARAAGVKVIPRFTYSFPQNVETLGYHDTDAPLPIVLGHIAQLSPILRRNADVIAFMEAGFVGGWGEWHDSTSGLQDPAAEQAILAKLLDVLPPTRMVALRYQRDVIALTGSPSPPSAAEAFSGDRLSRIAHHDDCFLASADDWGSYELNGKRSLAEQRAYLARANQFVAQGGETCNANAQAAPFITCSYALSELAYLHFSQLNIDYEPQVLEGWRRAGCFGEISRRLGYRFRLVSARLTAASTPGGFLEGRFEIANDGFAAPYNPRLVELVLRSRSTGEEHRLPLDADPRRWAPGKSSLVRFQLRVPSSMQPGDYDLFLSLPDPEPALRPRPAYAIRLANTGMWRAAAGLNDLQLRLRLRPQP